MLNVFPSEKIFESTTFSHSSLAKAKSQIDHSADENTFLITGNTTHIYKKNT